MDDLVIRLQKQAERGTYIPDGPELMREVIAELEALSCKISQLLSVNYDLRKERERYALQVCLLLDAMREAGVHIAENWCWCAPTVTNYGDSEQETNVNDCKTYDKDGKLLTVCHNLASAEARQAEAETLLDEILPCVLGAETQREFRSRIAAFRAADSACPVHKQHDPDCPACPPPPDSADVIHGGKAASAKAATLLRGWLTDDSDKDEQARSLAETQAALSASEDAAK